MQLVAGKRKEPEDSGSGARVAVVATGGGGGGSASLPPEVWLTVLEWLHSSRRDVAVAACTCRLWRALVVSHRGLRARWLYFTLPWRLLEQKTRIDASGQHRAVSPSLRKVPLQCRTPGFCAAAVAQDPSFLLHVPSASLTRPVVLAA